MYSEWVARKKHFVERLYKEFEEGRVDYDLMDLLNLINNLGDYYTTSSCSGRIQVIEARMPGDKYSIRVLGKWHWTISLEDLLEALKKGEKNVWLMAQPPILHVAARSFEDALKIMSLARKSGFKHSGVQVFKPDRVHVEIMASEEMTVTLIWKGVWIVNRRELSLLVEISNELLKRAKEKLQRFKRAIVEEFYSNELPG